MWRWIKGDIRNNRRVTNGTGMLQKCAFLLSRLFSSPSPQQCLWFRSINYCAQMHFMDATSLGKKIKKACQDVPFSQDCRCSASLLSAPGPKFTFKLSPCRNWSKCMALSSKIFKLDDSKAIKCDRTFHWQMNCTASQSGGEAALITGLECKEINSNGAEHPQYKEGEMLLSLKHHWCYAKTSN